MGVFTQHSGLRSAAMILGYNHAMITVPDGNAEKVRQFYSKVLGLTELAVPPSLQGRGLIWFKIGDRELHVGTEDGIDRKTRAHLAFEVDDIVTLRGRLTFEGMELIEQPRIEHFDRFHTFDPFGNRIEFMQRLD